MINFKIISVVSFIIFLCFNCFAKEYREPTIRPLVWLTNEKLLVGINNEIREWDVNSKNPGRIVTGPYFFYGEQCFTANSGFFPISGPVIKKVNRSVITSYESIRYRWIKDWDMLANAEEFSYFLKPRLNPLDCQILEHRPWTKEEMMNADGFGESNPENQLLRTVDGQAKVFFQKSKNESLNRMVLIKKDREIKKVDLGKDSSGWPLDAFYDQSSNEYFWSPVMKSFDIAYKFWPIKGWWISSKGEMLREVSIPAGPWIKEYTLPYRLRYFSCGPDCYINMKMMVGNRRIYIHVWGDAVGSEQGIYRLNTDEQKWEKLVKGAIDKGVILSPDGCYISYVQDDSLEFINVCGGKINLPTT